MHRKLRLFGTLTLLAGVLAYAGPRQASAAVTQQTAAQDWQAVVGHQVFTEPGDKASTQALRFYPETITINAGDSITWKFDSGAEPHTVSFLGNQPFPDLIPAPPGGAPGGAPSGPPAGSALPPKIEANPLVFFPQGGTSYDGKALTSSGFIAADIPGPKNYKLVFPTAGTFDYVCLLHAGVDPQTNQVQGMKAKVVVQTAGSAYPKTQAQVNTDVAAQVKTDEEDAAKYAARAKEGAGASRSNSNGRETYHVNVGYTSDDGLLDYQRFDPPDLIINQGDTVEWSMPTSGFHTVTLGEEPELVSIEPQPSGPPKAYLNVAALAPAGGQVHSGTGFYSSGALLGPNDPEGGFPFPQVKSYSLTFNQPGRYEYICTVHYLQGMDAFITVKASAGGSVPGMPTTGNSAGWTPFAMLGGLLLAVAGLALRRRKVGETA